VPGAVIPLVVAATSPTPDLHSANDRGVLSTLVATPDQAELQIGMTDAPDPVLAGANVTYTIVVRSLGPATATNVTLTDTLPAGFALVSATPTQGSCTGTACALGTIAPSGTATVTIVATASATGEFTNTATVSADQPDPVPSNNTANETTTVATADQADVVIEILGPTVMRPGESSFYTIEIDNLGPGPAANVEIANFLPPGFTFYANAGDCVVAFPCEFEDLEPGGKRTIVTTFTVDPLFAAPSNAVITAALTMATVDPTPNTHTVSLTTAVYPGGSADLAVTLASSPNPVYTGTSMSYSLTVANHGPSAATAVTLTLALPPGVRLISARATAGSCSGTTVVTCRLGDMPEGSLARIGILAIAPASVPAVNPMIATALATSGSPDPNPGTNRTTEATTVVGLPGTDAADLAIAIQGPVSVRAGANATYTLTISNAGPASASAVFVDDPAPAGLTFVSVSGACTSPFPCALGSMAAGDTQAVTATYAVPLGYAGANPIVNAATVSSTTFDPVAGNNSASVRTVVGFRSTGCAVDGLASIVGAGAPAGGAAISLSSAPSRRAAFAPYDSAFAGGASVACGDVNGDGVPEIVTGAGPGGSPLVRVWTLAGGAVTKIAEFFAYDPGFRGGVSVAVGDVTGSGIAEIVTGAGPGGGPHVRVWDLNGGAVAEVAGFFAYDPAFAGGVSVAVGDVTGDGVAEIITGAGPGGGPHVRVWQLNGATFSELAGVFAYDPAFPGGVSVAAGDLTGEGLAEIVTGAGPGGGPHVRVWKVTAGGLTEISGFFAYDPAFTGGVSVAVGDLNGDGIAELVTGAGRGGGTDVRVWDLSGRSAVELADFAAFPSFAGPVAVAVGDLSGDGVAELITSAGPGGEPQVRVWNFVDTKATELAGFFAYDPAFSGGVSVAVADVTGDGVPDLITGAGPGGGPHVRAWQLAATAATEEAGFFAFDPAFSGGVSVAAGDLNGDGGAELVTGAGAGGAPRVRVWSAMGGQVVPLADFLAYDPLFQGGVRVAVGDLTGDGVAELVTGPGPGGGPHVRVWDLRNGQVAEVAGFFAFEPRFTGGVSVAVGDLTGDGIAELVTAAGVLGGSRVRVWSLLGGKPQLLSEFVAYDPASPWTVSVAVGAVTGDGVGKIVTAPGAGGSPDVRVWSLNGSSVTELAEFFAYDPAFRGGVALATGDLNGTGVAQIVTGAGPGGGPHVRVWQLAVGSPALRAGGPP